MNANFHIFISVPINLCRLLHACMDGLQVRRCRSSTTVMGTGGWPAPSRQAGRATSPATTWLQSRACRHRSEWAHCIVHVHAVIRTVCQDCIQKMELGLGGGGGALTRYVTCTYVHMCRTHQSKKIWSLAIFRALKDG